MGCPLLGSGLNHPQVEGGEIKPTTRAMFVVVVLLNVEGFLAAGHGQPDLGQQFGIEQGSVLEPVGIRHTVSGAECIE